MSTTDQPTVPDEVGAAMTDADVQVAGSSLAAASLPKGSPVTVCGAVSSGLGLATKVKLAAMKQKPTHGIFVHV